MAELSRNEVVERVAAGKPVSRADLCDIDLSNAVLENADLRRSDLDGANLEGANLSRSQLRSASLREAYLVAADLHGANLENCDLEGARLEGADLRGANLARANLEGANLTGAKLGGAVLTGAQLESAMMGQADLSKAQLLHAELANAYLAGANLRGAKLCNADLTSANLEEAELEGADLTGATLDNTITRGARGMSVPTARAPTNGHGGQGRVARYFGKGDVLKGATLVLDAGARVEIESLFEDCTIEIGDGTELIIGRSGVLAECKVIGRGNIYVRGKFYERSSPGIVGPAQVVVSTGGCLVAEVEQAADATCFAFEPGSNLRIKIRNPSATSSSK